MILMSFLGLEGIADEPLLRVSNGSRILFPRADNLKFILNCGIEASDFSVQCKRCISQSCLGGDTHR